MVETGGRGIGRGGKGFWCQGQPIHWRRLDSDKGTDKDKDGRENVDGGREEDMCKTV